MTTELPQTLAANPRLSTWFSVDRSGVFALRIGKVELGQGIITALTQIAATELSVDASHVVPVATNTGRSPDEGITAGSMSIAVSGAAVRHAAAQVRQLFLRAAARRSGLPDVALHVTDGRILDVDGNEVATYAGLSAEVSLDVDAGDTDIEFIDKTSGPDLARIDLPDKVFGRRRFIHDLTFADMLHGRVVRPPRPGAHLTDVPPIELPGVELIVREGDFLAVIADREGRADRAAAALAAGTTWAGGTDLPDRRDLSAWLRAQPVESTQIHHDGAVHADGPTLSATYAKPFVAHGSIAPSCAIALFEDGTLRVWSHSQGVFPLGRELASALGLDPAEVIVQHVEGAGSYGHNSADDAAFDAAFLATRLPGRHIRVQWSRADELAWEPFGPAMVSDVSATLVGGRISDWSYEVWSNGHTARPGYTPAHGMLGDALRAGVALPPSIDPPPARSFGGGRNAEPYYDFARADITGHRLLTMPLRASALRSLGAHHNIFALESFMDELARIAGRDPLEFRLGHLTDPRARDVLTTAATAADWGSPRDGDGGRGIAFCRYKNRGSYCAVVAEVEATESVRVKRLTIAVDVGRVVNADGVRNQIEGGAIQATSWSIREQVAFDRSAVTSTDWESYPILRFSEVPRVDVRLIGRPGEPTLGAGEATQGPVPAAIGNAIFDAIGVRVRTLPFTTENIVAAIDADSRR